MIMTKPYGTFCLAGLLLGSLLCLAAAPVDPGARRISLGGEWKFAPEVAGEGLREGWAAPGYDDSAWAGLVAGTGWKQQEISHSGFGWYRKSIEVPESYRGMPLTLCFGEICYDDDVYFNGVRVGGLHGPYKYRNLAKREYAVPESLIRFGEKNLVAVRAWGMLGEGVEGNRFGLTEGPFQAVFDPLQVMLRRTDKPNAGPCAPQMFDLSDAQPGMTFEVIMSFANASLRSHSVRASYRLTDFYGTELLRGTASVRTGEGPVFQAIIPVDRETARRIYLAGRFCASAQITDIRGHLLQERTDTVDRISFHDRETRILPVQYDGIFHETPYGRLRLVDEIDCSQDIATDPHPYMQSGFDDRQQYRTPGSPVEVKVSEVLGRKARESGFGWFAYRIGRGKLRPHACYLVRVEYPEDKPRYCPLEILVGENYQNVAWRSGISSDNPYDNWPLSGRWEWFDTIVPLDDETSGTSGANGASTQGGFWVYVMNKRNYPSYFPLFEGGPAVARIRLYELDQANAPVIRYPDNAPRRVLMLDWERQPLMEPEDVVGYSRLMGYNAVSPVVMKWAFMNYADPIPGYDTYNDDAQGYWDKLATPPGSVPGASVPGRKSIHSRYLEATSRAGMGYIPRIEYGGSYELPEEARAVDGEGRPAKPNRFAPWCGDLLHPAVYDDFSRLLDSLIGKNAARNPQMLGILWRIRSDRMPISYSRSDISLFTAETAVKPPQGLTDRELAIWASQGAAAARYTVWWHRKRAEFHGRIAQRLASYRPGMKLWFYNWDNDKFSLGMHDFTGWDFLGKAARMAESDPEGALEMYRDNIEKRKRFTTDDYLEMMRTGNLGVKTQGYLPHHGVRPWLYRDIPGVALLAPVNARYTAEAADFLNYFRTAEGLSVSNPVVYDETCSRFINPKYEGNMSVPGGAQFSMALELLSWFHGDARMLTFTSYTYARGFAGAHRRFAQAFLALPAIDGKSIGTSDPDICIRVYCTDGAVYVGVASKSYEAKKIKVAIPVAEMSRTTMTEVTDQVTGLRVPVKNEGERICFEVDSEPMQLHAFRMAQTN